MSNVVLLEVPKYLHAPDWIAFESVLRNLRKLQNLPAGTLVEGLYALAMEMPDGPWTAEQVLDEAEARIVNIRVAIQNQRAAQSKI